MIRFIFLDEVNSEEQEESGVLNLVLKGDLRCFAALALDLLQEDVPRQEELKVLKDLKVFLMMIFDESKSRVLLDPKISLVRSDDGKSALEWCKRWTGNLNLGGMPSFE